MSQKLGHVAAVLAEPVARTPQHSGGATAAEKKFGPNVAKIILDADQFVKDGEALRVTIDRDFELTKKKAKVGCYRL